MWIEVEQSLIGACLHNPELIDKVDGIVGAGHFGDPIHSYIFESMTTARESGSKFDLKLLVSALGKTFSEFLVDGKSVTVSQYIARMAAEAPSLNNVIDYARNIKNNALMRDLNEIAGDISESIEHGSIHQSPATIAAKAITKLDAVATQGTPQGQQRVSMGFAVNEAIAEAADAYQNGKQRGVTWGLSDMDKTTLGMCDGQLIILAARPGMGKTTVATHVALSAAMRSTERGNGVLYVSLEMLAIELANRSISSMAYKAGQRIPYQHILAGEITEDQFRHVYDAGDDLKRLPFEIEQQAGLTVSQIAARARKAKQSFIAQGNDLRLVVVDHIGLISMPNSSGNNARDVGLVTTALKTLAKELGCPVLALSQLSRGVEGRENKRPMLSDLRDSGRIEEDADTVVFLYREAYYLKDPCDKPEDELERMRKLEMVNNNLDLIIAKQRQGECRTITAHLEIDVNGLCDKDYRQY